jgi:Tol biopolymer transport system component
VLIVNGDGSGLGRVTPLCRHRFVLPRIPRGCSDATGGSFTPDGRHILYARASGRIRSFPQLESELVEHSAVAVVGADGRGGRDVHRLPRYAGELSSPQMSPDGRLIAFERANGPLARPRFGRALFVMNADGSNARRVTPWGLHAGDTTDWAPDSSRLLFRSNVGFNDQRSQYFTVRPDGTGRTRLTSFPAGRRLFSASFSPDGTQIVFAIADPLGRGDLWVMNADGTAAHPLLLDPAADSAPDWSAAP